MERAGQCPRSPRMKAAVYTRYGPPEVVVQIANVEKPVPKDNEVSIKVRAALPPAVRETPGLSKKRPNLKNLLFLFFCRWTGKAESLSAQSLSACGPMQL